MVCYAPVSDGIYFRLVVSGYLTSSCIEAKVALKFNQTMICFCSDPVGTGKLFFCAAFLNFALHYYIFYRIFWYHL